VTNWLINTYKYFYIPCCTVPDITSITELALELYVNTPWKNSTIWVPVWEIYKCQGVHHSL